MRVGLDNKYLDFTGALSDSIGRIDITNSKFKSWHNTAPLSAASVPSEDASDTLGNMYFCTWTQNLLRRLTPSTGAQEQLAIPHTSVVAPVSLPFGFGIVLEFYNVNGANEIYFTQATVSRVGRLQLPA